MGVDVPGRTGPGAQSLMTPFERKDLPWILALAVVVVFVVVVSLWLQ